MEAPLSHFERVFESWPAGMSISSAREDRFDQNHGLFYSPLTYDSAPVERPNAPMPPEEWLSPALEEFIRDEFGNPAFVAESGSGRAESEEGDLLAAALELRDQYEQRLVYAGVLEDILRDVPPFDALAGVYKTLCNDAFGRSENEVNVSYDAFLQKMRHARVGCRLTLLGLPFRDQNPFRVINNPEDVTLAEAYFLVRLHCTALAIYQSLPTGADILVLSDGSLYAPVLGVEMDESATYLRNVRALRDYLNLRGTVSIVNLLDLIELYDSGTKVFWSCCDAIEAWIARFRRTSGANKLDALDRGMRWNMNTRRLGVPQEVLRQWLDGAMPRARQADALPGPDEVAKVSNRYAAINLALRWHNVVANMLPTTVRATVHAKNGQLAIPRLGSCLPWNGVAVWTEDHRGGVELEVHSLLEATRRKLRLRERRDARGTIIYYDRRR